MAHLNGLDAEKPSRLSSLQHTSFYFGFSPFPSCSWPLALLQEGSEARRISVPSQLLSPLPLSTPSLSPSLQGETETTLLLNCAPISCGGVTALPCSRFQNSWEGEGEEEGKVRRV